MKKYSSFQEQLAKSEETRRKMEEHSKTFLKDLQIKTNQREMTLQNTQIELKKAQTSKEEAQQELESVKLRLQKQELMVKEAGKIIQNITVEKNKKISELKDANELCDKMQNLILDKETLVSSLTKHKASITEQNKEFQRQTTRQQEKIKISEKKILEFEREMKRLRNIVMDLEQKNGKAGQLNAVIKERLDWMSKANSDNKQAMERNIYEKNELVKQLSALQSERRDAEKQIQNIKNILAEKELLITELEQRNRETESQKEQLDLNLRDLKNKLRESENQVVSLNNTASSLKDKEKALSQENAELERAKNEEINVMKKEFEAVRFYLVNSEEIIANLTKDRDTLMQEYEKAVHTHKEVIQTIETYNKSLVNDKKTLEERLKQVEKEAIERNSEIGDLKNMLSSAKTAEQYLNEKVQEQNSIKQDLEKKKEEINSLKDQLRETERTHEKETHEERKRIKKSEEYFARLRDEKDKLEANLRDKDNDIQEAQKTNSRLTQENENLDALVNKTNVMNKELELAVLSYRGEAEGLKSTLSQLKTENELLKEYAKDTETTKLKLESVQGKWN